MKPNANGENPPIVTRYSGSTVVTISAEMSVSRLVAPSSDAPCVLTRRRVAGRARSSPIGTRELVHALRRRAGRKAVTANRRASSQRAPTLSVRPPVSDTCSTADPAKPQTAGRPATRTRRGSRRPRRVASNGSARTARVTNASAPR